MKKIIAVLLVVLTLASLAVMTVSGASWNDSVNETSDGSADVITVGDVIIPYLWYDTFDEPNDRLTRHYQMYFQKVATEGVNEFNTLGAVRFASSGLKENGTTTFISAEDRWAYVYTYNYLTEDNMPDWQYDDSTEFSYDSIVVWVTFKEDGAPIDSSLVQEHTLTYKNEAQTTNTVYGFSFKDNATMLNEYQVDINVRLYGGNGVDFVDIKKSSYITVRSELYSDQLTQQEGYSNGYNDGYDDGYNGGYDDGYAQGLQDSEEANEEWSFFALINAIIEAPFRLINEMLDFEVFGVNFANFVRVVLTFALVGFVLIKLAGLFI